MPTQNPIKSNTYHVAISSYFLRNQKGRRGGKGDVNLPSSKRRKERQEVESHEIDMRRSGESWMKEWESLSQKNEKGLIEKNE